MGGCIYGISLRWEDASMGLVSDGRMHHRERSCEKVCWMELADLVMMVMDLQPC